MHKGLIVFAALGIVACQKTGDNQYEVNGRGWLPIR